MQKFRRHGREFLGHNGIIYTLIKGGVDDPVRSKALRALLRKYRRKQRASTPALEVVK